MLELINILLKIEDFYTLTLRFDYYGIPSERYYYISLFGNPLLVDKNRIFISHTLIKYIIKYV